MAARRMFAKAVVQQDSFLDMPLSTQALYFHLGMEADDDGFLDTARRVMRSIGASVDDLRVLIAKGFILEVGEGIVVITHWKASNYVQSDRYKPTLHTEKKAMLSLANGQKYVLNPREEIQYLQDASTLDTKCIQDASTLDTQYRLGEVRVGKVRLNTPSPHVAHAVDEGFEVFWKAYPKKKGKKDALKAFKKLKPTQDMLDQMLAAIEQQKKSEQWQREHGQYIPYPAKWLKHGQWEDEVEESAHRRDTRADKILT